MGKLVRPASLAVLAILAAGSLWAQPAVDPVRFLEQATWGPTPESVAHLQDLGVGPWLDEQFSAAPSPIPDAPAGTTSLRPAQQSFFVNALGGQDQLRQRVAFALAQIWVVSGLKINRPEQLIPYLRLLQNDAFANYLQLMWDVTLSPAMGHYLDMVNNDKPIAAAGRSANENYARELLQLFTLGEVALRKNGTQIVVRGQPVATYDQATVENLARVFTGWTYAPVPGAPMRAHNPANWDAPMVPYDPNHDTGAKMLFGRFPLPAGQSAEMDMTQALDTVFHRPSMGPFVARQLIQHLVTSNPSPAYVARVADAFNDNGVGVRGDMQAVVTAILVDQEARDGDWAPATAIGGHLREPVLYVNALLRALGGATSGANNLPDWTNRMGQNLYFPASVFNYFSPSYRIAGTSLLGPEFQIYSPATAMSRVDFVNTLVFGSLGGGTTIDLNPFIANAASDAALVDAVGAVLLGGRMPSDMRKTVLTAVAAATTARLKAQTALYLVAGSALYQVEH